VKFLGALFGVLESRSAAAMVYSLFVTCLQNRLLNPAVSGHAVNRQGLKFVIGRRWAPKTKCEQWFLGSSSQLLSAEQL
jgi:hypothetical protein